MLSSAAWLCTVAAPLHLDFWSDFAITAGAYAIEASVGYPDAVFRAIKHPVVWVGALLSGLERGLNRGSSGRRRAAGVLTIAVVLLVVCGPAVLLQAVVPGVGAGRVGGSGEFVAGAAEPGAVCGRRCNRVGAGWLGGRAAGRGAYRRA